MNRSKIEEALAALVGNAHFLRVGSGPDLLTDKQLREGIGKLQQELDTIRQEAEK